MAPGSTMPKSRVSIAISLPVTHGPGNGRIHLTMPYFTSSRLVPLLWAAGVSRHLHEQSPEITAEAQQKETTHDDGNGPSRQAAVGQVLPVLWILLAMTPRALSLGEQVDVGAVFRWLGRAIAVVAVRDLS